MTSLKLWPIWREDPADFEDRGQIVIDLGLFFSEEAAQRAANKANAALKISNINLNRGYGYGNYYEVWDPIEVHPDA
jgi:hypothetical protein